jgi:hypothetical protein
MWRMPIASVFLSVALLAPPSPAVTCQVRDDPRGRTFVLESGDQAPHAWRLSMRDRESGAKWVRLSLPGAAPTLSGGVASLAYKNANGGRQVTLDVAPGHARLEVYVDHGLEVNIEPDLDPNVDRMNTNGPLTALACTITQ